jgi:hypothetical protein
VNENVTGCKLMVGNKDVGCRLTRVMVVVIMVAVGFRNGPIISSMEQVVVAIRPMEYRYLLHRG